mgnify:CR=1 FL=1
MTERLQYQDDPRFDVIRSFIVKAGGEIDVSAGADAILRFIDQHERREIARLGPPFMALVTLIQYAEFTVGPESLFHHPTMPSAVAAAKTALRRLHWAINGTEIELGRKGRVPTIVLGSPVDEEDMTPEQIAERDREGARLVRALWAAGFAKDSLRVNPSHVDVNLLAEGPSEDERLLATLLEVQEAVFGLTPGSEPDIYADDERLSAMERKMAEATSTLRERIIAAGERQAAVGGDLNVEPAKPVPVGDPVKIVSDLLTLWVCAARSCKLGGRPDPLEGALADEVRAFVENPQGDGSDLIRRLVPMCEGAIRDSLMKTSFGLTREGQAANAYLHSIQKNSA